MGRLGEDASLIFRQRASGFSIAAGRNGKFIDGKGIPPRLASRNGYEMPIIRVIRVLFPHP
jgi:hypothetical protein